MCASRRAARLSRQRGCDRCRPVRGSRARREGARTRARGARPPSRDSDDAALHRAARRRALCTVLGRRAISAAAGSTSGAPKHRRRREADQAARDRPGRAGGDQADGRRSGRAGVRDCDGRQPEPIQRAQRDPHTRGRARERGAGGERRHGAAAPNAARLPRHTFASLLSRSASRPVVVAS